MKIGSLECFLKFLLKYVIMYIFIFFSNISKQTFFYVLSILPFLALQIFFNYSKSNNQDFSKIHIYLKKVDTRLTCIKIYHSAELTRHLSFNIEITLVISWSENSSIVETYNVFKLYIRLLLCLSSSGCVSWLKTERVEIAPRK